MNIMTYKGYAARIEYSDEDQLLIGHVAGIRDVIGFHGESISELRQAFEEAFHKYVDFYLEHMRLEETVILPEAERCLSEEDWLLLDAAFAENADPLTGHYPPAQEFEKLFSLIVTRAPSPIGLG